jgi:hypothetical protein
MSMKQTLKSTVQRISNESIYMYNRKEYLIFMNIWYATETRPTICQYPWPLDYFKGETSCLTH